MNVLQSKTESGFSVGDVGQVRHTYHSLIVLAAFLGADNFLTHHFIAEV